MLNRQSFSMLSQRLAFVFAIVLIVNLLASASVRAKDPPGAEAQAEMMKQWMEFATPGEPHEQLARLAGTWKAEMADYSANPDEPITAKGTAKYEMIMGGRYLKCNYESTYMGNPFQGMAIQGYDNKLKKYVSIWIDSFGTGIMNAKGTYDVATHTLTEHAEMSSPTGLMKMKMVTEYKDNDNFVTSMYNIGDDGDETLSMKISYSR